MHFIAEPHIVSEFWIGQWSVFAIIYWYSVLASSYALYKKLMQGKSEKKPEGCWSKFNAKRKVFTDWLDISKDWLVIFLYPHVWKILV